RLSALIKCIEEAKAGNREFEGAMAGIKERLGEMHLPEVDAFCEEFLPSYEKNLDELYS
ncbi:MAG: 5'-deoxynucleotidase, partial [Lachnospiraceae bacterium]|nr:5'-deoxynucleotidase [Lachnospiraceae bacterium]